MEHKRPPTLLIMNPRASGLDDGIASALSLLSERLDLNVAETPDDVAGGGDSLANKLNAAERIIIAGGDGTLHRLLPLLLEAGKPIGVVPLGTANDFAKSIEMPLDLQEACEAVSGTTVGNVDVGMINGRPFLNVASLGVATSISRLQSTERKKFLGILSYPVSLVQAVMQAQPFHAKITQSGKTMFQGFVLQASFGNGRYHGGGLRSGPHARIDDGLLHMYTVAARRWWRLLPVIPALIFGLHRSVRHVHAFSAAACSIQTRLRKRVTVDGEVVPTKCHTFDFAIRPGALTVFVPNRLNRGQTGLTSSQIQSFGQARQPARLKTSSKVQHARMHRASANL
jgi:diacylglycerol kinase (ATP)